MKKNWPFIVDAIIREEVRPGHEQDGDLHMDPDDPGGTTKFGIAQKYNPDVDVATLTRSGAEAIYHAKYWTEVDGNALPTGVDLIMMNVAVNAGVSRAKAYQDAAENQIEPDFKESYLPVFIEMFIDRFTQLVEHFYNHRPDYIKGQPFKIKYLQGWLKRTRRIAQKARTMLYAEMIGQPITYESVRALMKMNKIPDVEIDRT